MLTTSHDGLCMKAIVVEYVGLMFLGRLSLAPSRRCSDSFPRRRAFYTFTRSHARGQKATHQILTSICDASFGRQDKTSSAMRTPVFFDERLGIDPAVEFGGVAAPFHQSLRSSAYFAALQYRFHAVHFIGGYRQLLQLRFVEGSVHHFSEIVDQSLQGRIGGMNLVYREHLFVPIRHVAFVELTIVLTDAHAI